jgi:hypothetical protein
MKYKVVTTCESNGNKMVETMDMVMGFLEEHDYVCSSTFNLQAHAIVKEHVDIKGTMDHTRYYGGDGFVVIFFMYDKLPGYVYGVLTLLDDEILAMQIKLMV